MPVAVLLPSTTGLGHFLTSQGQSENDCTDMKVSDNFMIGTIEKSTRRESFIHKGYFGNRYDSE